MGSFKKKLFTALNQLDEQRYPDSEADMFSLQRRKLLLDIKAQISPNSAEYRSELAAFNQEVLKRLRPPVLDEDLPINDLTTLRKNYENDLSTLEYEGLNVDEHTNAARFTRLLKRLREKYERLQQNALK